MSQTVRVRFAPSPTGFLHIGGVRVALFNWLYARQNKGQFLLRIEDTDLERSEDRYTRDILASLKWLGLESDEEPLYQSKRLELYREKAEELIQSGHAYRCYCTEDEVEQMRTKAQAEGKKPQYDRTCRENPRSQGRASYVIRAKIPLVGKTSFDDLIRGTITVDHADLDDFVLIRSNGAPTYNLSVVIDDIESRITHLLRGDDHINNTPKQIQIYQFFGKAIPLFAHLPMILGADKKKLSKRHGAVSANLYRAEGYLPEALLNFLARLGWSHGDQEIFSIQEIIQYFSFENTQKSSAVFNQEKLLWLNGHYIRSVDPVRLQQIVIEDYSDYFQPQAAERLRSPEVLPLISLIQPKVKLLKELADQLVPLCISGAVPIDPALIKWGKASDQKAVLQSAILDVHRTLNHKISGESRRAPGPWGTSPSLLELGMTHEMINEVLKQISDQHGVKLSDLAQPLRVAVTGRTISAGLFDLMATLPWDVIEPRILGIGRD